LSEEGETGTGAKESFSNEPTNPDDLKKALDAIGVKPQSQSEPAVRRSNPIQAPPSSQNADRNQSAGSEVLNQTAGQGGGSQPSLMSKAQAALANAKKATGLSPLQLAAKRKEEEQARSAQEEAEAESRVMRARQEEPSIPKNRWGQAPDSATSQSIWVDQLGITKKAEPIRGPSASLRGRLKRVMSSDMFNVKELYSLRGIAALFVFVAQAQLFVAHSKPTYPLSVIGAQIFFVISGFVITRWLLVNEKDSLKSTLGEFYARRALRIFPMYYLVLGVLLCTSHLPHADSFFCGLFNLKVFEGAKIPSQLLQYWTLSVELQFYALFPCLLIATPQRFRAAMVILLTVGCGICAYMSAQAHAHVQDWLLLSISGQYIMWGCLAGYMDVKSNIALSVNASACVLLGLAGQAALHAWLICFDKASVLAVTNLLWKSLSTFNACTMAILIFGLWRTSNAILKGLFANEALVYFGKISYGFYLLLPLCFFMQSSIIAVMPVLAKVPPILTSFIITFIGAVLTFHYFQAPINNMRERLPIVR
jgi:peptidoglycan/LPS O-acetylase OafA/YrhL